VTYFKILSFLNFLNLSASCFVFFVLSSCNPDYDYDRINYFVKEIKSDIDTFTFWNNENVYIIRKTNFTVRAPLIIQKGTVIKFDPDSGRSINVLDSGYIVSQGSIDKRIVFTSIYDDFYGGDNNHDGNSSKPNAGDWNEIYIHSTQSSFFTNTDFYYGGGSKTKSTIRIGEKTWAEIRNCTFAHNKGGNIDESKGVVNAYYADYKTRIYNNIFYDNELPLSINNIMSIDNSNTFKNPKDTIQKNKYNSIIINGSTPYTINSSWYVKEVAFVIDGPQFEIKGDYYLTLGNDVVVKFKKNVLLWIENPISSIRNIDGPGVILTSIYDDKNMGDTNGDGSATSPSKYDWMIFVNNEKESLNWSNIFYAKLKE